MSLKERGLKGLEAEFIWCKKGTSGELSERGNESADFIKYGGIS
jgi:hypothetical protein